MTNAATTSDASALATRIQLRDPSNGDRARDAMVGKLRIKSFKGKSFAKFFTAFEEAAEAAKWTDERKMTKFQDYLRGEEPLYIWKGIKAEKDDAGRRIRWMDAINKYREVFQTDTEREEKRMRVKALERFVKKITKHCKEKNDAVNATKVTLMANNLGLSERKLVGMMMQVILQVSVRRLENARPAPNLPGEVLDLIKKLAPKSTSIQHVIRNSCQGGEDESSDSSESSSSESKDSGSSSEHGTEYESSTEEDFKLDYGDSTEESSDEAEMVKKARKARLTAAKPRKTKTVKKQSKPQLQQPQQQPQQPKETPKEKIDMESITDQISKLVLMVQQGNSEKMRFEAGKGCFYCDGEHSMHYCSLLAEDESNGLVTCRNGMICLANGDPVPRANPRTGAMRNFVLLSTRGSEAETSENRTLRTVNFICADGFSNAIDIITTDEYSSEAEVLYASEEGRDEYDVDMAEKRRRETADDANRVTGIPEVVDTRPSRVVRPRMQEPTTPVVAVRAEAPASAVRAEAPVTRAQASGRRGESQDVIMRGTPRGEPSFRYLSPVERREGAEERTLNLLMNTTIPVPIADLLAVSQSVRNQMQKQVTRNKVPNPASRSPSANLIEGEVLGSYVETPINADVLNEPRIIGYPPYATKSVQVEGYVNGHKLSLVIDPGSELNVCNTECFRELGILITPDDGRIQMKGVTGHTATTKGICRGFEVCIGQMCAETSALAVEDFKYQLLLGLPFLESANWRVGRNKEGRTVYLLEKVGIQVAFGAIDPQYDPKMKTAAEPGCIEVARQKAVGFNGSFDVNLVVADYKMDRNEGENKTCDEIPDGTYLLEMPYELRECDSAKFK
ncbi:hypothetical protein J3B02_002257 [Coemansia erecta]|nr:hypothetical protein J3B02_002257 [Coemansia erecta]